MNLKEILNKLADNQTPVLLSDGSKEWEAGDLLGQLSEPMLKRAAHMQAGLYIAEINPSGYLGSILYRIKPKS